MQFSSHGFLKSFLKQQPKPKYTIGQLSQEPIKQIKIDQCNISIVKNDLTIEKVDAIVNAANNFLAHGGGVAGAISRKGGDIIQDESDEIMKQRRKIPNGDSVTTSAGRLPCKYIIHTVGPIWDDGESNEKEELAQCVSTIFREAKLKDLKSISIPAVSSGIFGFPKDLCAQILINEVEKLIKSNQYPNLQEVRFCNFDNETVSYFLNAFDEKFNQIQPNQDLNQEEQKVDDKEDDKKKEEVLEESNKIKRDESLHQEFDKLNINHAQEKHKDQEINSSPKKVKEGVEDKDRIKTNL